MADITTVANAKSWLGITGASDDALLARLVSSASDFIQAWLNRQIASQVYVDTWDGGGGKKYSTAAYPISAVSGVVVDGIAIPQSTGSSVPGWVASKTQIALIGYRFSEGVQNCTATYTAGYATTPTEIEQACIELVGLRYRNRDRIGLNSKGANGETTSYSQIDLSGAITDALNQYRKVHMS